MSNFEIKHTEIQDSSGKKNLINRGVSSECCGEKTHTDQHGLTELLLPKYLNDSKNTAKMEQENIQD